MKCKIMKNSRMSLLLVLLLCSSQAFSKEEAKDTSKNAKANNHRHTAPMCTPSLIECMECKERDKALWESPDCPCPTGIPLNYARALEGAVVKVTPYGFVKYEAYWDTRQTAANREEHLLLFPLPRDIDPYGNDINDHGKWHMTTVESRIGIALTGPEWNGIKTDGIIEGEFRGSDFDFNITSFFARHAMGRISWDTGSLLFGQWWHPHFVLDCFAHTVAFSVGLPIASLSRHPQIRLSQKWGRYKVMFTAASQRSFQSNGPIDPLKPEIGEPSTRYIRDAVIPNLHLDLQAFCGDNVYGISGDYKRLVPRIVSAKGFSVKEHIDSFAVTAYASLRYAPWSLRVKGYWAQNGNDYLWISGFGVRTIDPVTDKRTYSNTAVAGAWLDFSYLFGCDNKELGIFAGGCKNLGSRHRLFVDPQTQLPTIYALTPIGQNIDHLIRVAPRFTWKKDPIRVGFEIEWNRASFGTPNACGKVKNACPVDDYRVHLAIYYMF